MMPAPDPPPPGAFVRLPTRADVRQIVAANAAELRTAADRGENVQQRALDQQDKLTRYADLLVQAHGRDAGAGFLALYVEEANAASAHLEHETAARAARGDGAETAGRVIGGVILVLVLVWLFSLLPRG